MRSRPRAIDLFCGAGGLSLGFEQAGFDIVSSVEIDPIHAGVHMYNFPRCKTFCEDIQTLSGKDLMCGHDKIEVIIGGPPCQGFSLIGKRDINDSRNSLIFQFMRIVSEVKPDYFVMENVGGITVGAAKDLLQNAIDYIRDFGYTVVSPYKILNAQMYGVPQARKRLFLLGYKIGLAEPKYPAPRDSSVVVRDAIDDLPNIDDFDVLLDDDRLPFTVAPASDYARKLHGSEPDNTDFSYRRRWNPDLITGEMRTIHTEKSKQRFHDTEPGQTEPVSRFLKLSPQGVCNTLRAGTDKSRGAYTSPRPIHPTHDRCISVREAQRLHSYPDWFRMHSTKWHGFREVGNSVPPLLARAVGAEVIKALGMKPYMPTETIELGEERFLYANQTEAKKIIEEQKKKCRIINTHR